MSFQMLIDTMEQLAQAHESLLELAQQKTKVLVNNDMDQLNFIINKEGKLVRHIGTLDQQRLRDISEYLISRGYNPNPNITVSDLIKLIFKFEDRQALIQAHSHLMGTLQALRQVNKSNQQLIQQSLSYIDYSIDLVLGPSDDDAVYHNPSQPKGDKRAGMFDTRV
jgi:flagellar biosynthesis/type III secretory pathway chaperone